MDNRAGSPYIVSDGTYRPASFVCGGLDISGTPEQPFIGQAMESSDLGEDLAIYFEHMALRQQVEGQQLHLRPPETALPFDAALLDAEQDVEHNIDQEIQHLMQIKEQLQKRQHHRQQQAQLLLAQQQNQQARLSPVTSGFTEQSFAMQQSSASAGWPAAGNAATAVRYGANPPRHSIDLGTLASIAALGRGQPTNGACFTASNVFNSDREISSSQQGHSLFAGQVGGAVAPCRIPAGLPRSPLPSSNNLAAAAPLDTSAGANNSVLTSTGAELQRLQVEQSNGVPGLSAGLLNGSSISCSTPLMSQELSLLCPQQEQLYAQSMLYAPAGAAEAPGAVSAQPAAFGAASNPTPNFMAHSQAVQLSDVVPDFSYTGQQQQQQQQQPSSFMTAQSGSVAAAGGAVGTDNLYVSLGLAGTPLTADAQGLMSTSNNAAEYESVALLHQQQVRQQQLQQQVLLKQLKQLQQQQEYRRRHSVDIPVFSSAAAMGSGYNGCYNQAVLQMPGQPQDNGLHVTGSSRSFSAVPTRTTPMAQVASSSGSFTAGCSQNMQCSMGSAQVTGGQSMHSMGCHADLMVTGSNGPVAAAVHEAQVRAVTGQVQNTRGGGSRRASIDIGAYSRSRLGPGASPSAHALAAAAGVAGRGGTSRVPPFSTPPATPIAGGAANSTTVPSISGGTPATPSPKADDGHRAAAACASTLSDRTSRHNSSSSSSSDASGTSNSSSSGKTDASAGAKQQLVSAAPKWAGSFWHPLTEVVKQGPAAAKKGTGVFIPPGMTDLL